MASAHATTDVAKLQEQVAKLQKEVKELEYKNPDNYTAPLICKPTKNCDHTGMSAMVPLTRRDMNKDFTGMVDKIDAWTCYDCGFHIQCYHRCIMYGCGQSVECGVKRCRDCLQLIKEQRELDKAGVKCIRCQYGGQFNPCPARALFRGKFCSRQCMDMCDLYDR
jgi:hypothetical protein